VRDLIAATAHTLGYALLTTSAIWLLFRFMH
jgi:hypothetical protein